MLVKYTNVLSSLKTTGEMNTAQVTVMSIVIVHSKLLNVKVLGTVKILLISPLKS
jgi:hypothetical protein